MEASPRLSSAQHDVVERVVVTPYVRAAGTAAMAVGGLVLAGWLLDLGILKSVLPGQVSMKPNTALAFVLSGASLRLQEGGRRGGRACAALVALIGLATLAEYLAGWNLGIDELLFRDDPAPVGTTHAGRMAQATALDFLLLGASLWCLKGPWPKGSEVLALGSGLVALPAFTGYLYDVPALGAALHPATQATRMAVHTSVGFLVLALGTLLARPEGGVAAILVDGGPGGSMIRRLLPAVAGVLLLLGWLRLRGQHRGLYGTEYGTALYCVSSLMILASLILWNAGRISRLDAVRHQGEVLLRGVLDTAHDAFVAIDERGRIIAWNRQAESLFGWSREEATGRRLSETLVPAAYRQRHEEGLRRLLQTGEGPVLNQRLELSALRRDGTEFPVELTIASPLPSKGGLFIPAFLRDIRERRRLEEELKRRASSLEAANKELEAFSYSVSHDLRAPLRAITGFSRILLEDHAGGLDAEGRRVLDVIIDNGNRMGHLIDDLLAFSRLGRKPMVLQRLDMAALAHAVGEELLAGTAGRPVDLRVGPLPQVQGDPALIRQVWMNLLSNALKYSRPRPRTEIEVSGERDGPECRYRVKDNGVGFDMRYVDKLFGVFQRLHEDREFEGTGVGLALVARIVSRHGGRVWAEGQVDRGATFGFSLPSEEASHVRSA